VTGRTLSKVQTIELLTCLTTDLTGFSTDGGMKVRTILSKNGKTDRCGSHHHLKNRFIYRSSVLMSNRIDISLYISTDLILPTRGRRVDGPKSSENGIFYLVFCLIDQV
jgi:hypothetical protein